jgi:hypothetical protein
MACTDILLGACIWSKEAEEEGVFCSSPLASRMQWIIELTNFAVVCTIELVNDWCHEMGMGTLTIE